MRARDVLLDRVESRKVWKDLEEMEGFNTSALEFTRLLQKADRYDGNVFLYEVRTSLHHHNIERQPAKLRSKAFREKIRKNEPEA